MPRPKIRVFWDLETCPISGSYEHLPEALKDIRQFTNNFGNVTSIKAYWDKNKVHSVDDPNLTVMPSMGVNLIDCSSMQGYTADALSKMLSVDVIVSAMDNPAEAESPEDNIIMIISGDKSVLYPISLLMFRNYTIFLAVPDDVQGVQPFQATRVFNWYTEVLGFDFSPEPTQPLVASPSKSPGWIVNGAHIPQLSLEKTTVATSSSKSISPHTMASMHKLPVVQTNPKTTPLSPSHPQGFRATSALGLSSNLHATTSTSTINFGTATAMRTDMGLDAAAVSETRPSVTHRENRDDGGDWDVGGGGAADWGTASGDWNSASGWNASGDWGVAASSWLPDPSPALAPEVKQKFTSRTIVETKQETREPQRHQATRPTFGGPSREVPLPHNPPLSAFKPLLDILGKAENASMRRSQLGEHLAKQKGLYQSAGVNTFGEYIAIALRKNLITLSGPDNLQQVKLKRRR